MRGGLARGAYGSQFRSACKAKSVAAAAAGVTLLAVLAGCGMASGDERLPVPTFPAASPQTESAQGPDDEGLPDDCTRVLDVDALAALFARPLGSVSLRSIKGIPEPTVERIERVGCRYSANGGGGILLDVNTGRYSDAAAALRQWKLNTNVERAGAQATDLKIGAAPAVLISKPTETVLAVVYGVDTYTFVLPATAGAPGSPQDRLIDLARRVLAVIIPTQPSTPEATPEPAAAAPSAPVSAAG